MKFNKVYLETIGYELPTTIITSAWIEEQLKPLYIKLHLQPGQLEALTGIKERRWWNPGHINSVQASIAAKKALEEANIDPSDIDVLIYAAVCRDELEPATACAVAANLGLKSQTEIYDITNACLGVINGIVDIAIRIELGLIRAGMVVACETAREITMNMIANMLKIGTMDYFKQAMATLTGGSGAVAVIITDGSFKPNRPQITHATVMAAPQFHKLCRWFHNQTMETNAIGLLTHGKELVKTLANAFYTETGLTPNTLDRLIAHQVAQANRFAILEGLSLTPDKDFNTFPYLGNMGTASLPITAAIAAERGFLQDNHNVAFMGIGSGLNSIMLAIKWRNLYDT